jgi:YggT family protein
VGGDRRPHRAHRALRAIRRIVPPLRLGMMALDLSPLILFVIIYVLQLINAAVFY